MKIRKKSLIIGICLALLLAWPMAAFAYTYVFKVPLKVQNIPPSEVGRVHKDSTVNVMVYDAGGVLVGQNRAQYQFQPGEQTLTIQVETTAPGAKYKVRLEGPGPLMDTGKSIREREGKL